MPPISDHYCILSGVWNGALDRSGVLRLAERAIFKATGVAPRSWAEGGYAAGAGAAAAQQAAR